MATPNAFRYVGRFVRFTGLTVALCSGVGAAAALAEPSNSARAFAENCFSPYLTAAKAKRAFQKTGGRYDFYDLTPFSNVAPSPAFGLRPATRGTDRRCEVSFNGNHTALAVDLAMAGLQAEGINREAPVPATHKPIPGTELLAARRLNPRRIAVVHVGTRNGPDGVETFMNVERLTPAASLGN